MNDDAEATYQRLEATMQRVFEEYDDRDELTNENFLAIWQKLVDTGVLE